MSRRRDGDVLAAAAPVLSALTSVPLPIDAYVLLSQTPTMAEPATPARAAAAAGDRDQRHVESCVAVDCEAGRALASMSAPRADLRLDLAVRTRTSAATPTPALAAEGRRRRRRRSICRRRRRVDGRRCRPRARSARADLRRHVWSPPSPSITTTTIEAETAAPCRRADRDRRSSTMSSVEVASTVMSPPRADASRVGLADRRGDVLVDDRRRSMIPAPMPTPPVEPPRPPAPFDDLVVVVARSRRCSGCARRRGLVDLRAVADVRLRDDRDHVDDDRAADRDVAVRERAAARSSSR